MNPLSAVRPAVARGLFSLALVVAGSPVWAQASVQVQDPWARPTAQGQPVAGGFMRIVGGATGDRLLSASAGVSERVELHTMSMDGDVMRMREVSAIEVPAGQTVELKPGGLHLMFMGLKAPLQAGTQFPVTLRFEKAGEVQATLRVEQRKTMNPHHGHSMGGHKH
jgi:copper(I)-binding protein